MSHSDPTEPLRELAAAQPDSVAGTSCNQTSFKVRGQAYLYVGPGPKGQGYKAMFKLERSLDRATERETLEPDRYQVGNQGWVTTRFTAEKPLPKSVWQNWLKESYALAAGAPKKSTSSEKKTTRRS